MTDPIGFLGLTHLGVVMSACWASLGDRVIAVGEPAAVDEPGLAALDCGDRLTISRDPAALSSCALVFVTLDTSDAQAVEHLLESALSGIQPTAIVVLMSQVPPGVTRRLADKWRVPTFYYLAETLITGMAVERCLHPDRFILGCPHPPWIPWCLSQALNRFDCPILRMRYESAEFAKLAINLYLASSIEYAIRMSWAAGRIGADWTNEVVPALRLDPRIGPDAYLRPGVVGLNIGRDIKTFENLFGGLI